MDDVANSVTNGAPWWLVVVIALASLAGGGLTAWVTRRRDAASAEQTMIDQLQEETKALRRDLTALTAEVRILRIREIAWITHTSTLTQIIGQAGQAVPPLPAELRNPIQVTEHREG